MRLKYTISSSKGYQPLYTVVDVESVEYYNAHKTRLQAYAIARICKRRGNMTIAELKKYGYTTIKVEEYTTENNTYLRGKEEYRARQQAYYKNKGLL
jgi:hypothetical protein